MGIADALERNLREFCRERLLLVGAAMVEDTKAACSRRVGTLADSIEIDTWAEEGDRFTTAIRATADYARYQDEGTGIYGPEGVPIVSLSGGPLAFVWPGAGTKVTKGNPNGLSFFMSVKGSPGTHFFTEPMPDRFSSACNSCF